MSVPQPVLNVVVDVFRASARRRPRLGMKFTAPWASQPSMCGDASLPWLPFYSGPKSTFEPWKWCRILFGQVIVMIVALAMAIAIPYGKVHDLPWQNHGSYTMGIAMGRAMVLAETRHGTCHDHCNGHCHGVSWSLPWALQSTCHRHPCVCREHAMDMVVSMNMSWTHHGSCHEHTMVIHDHR